jgi:hypothetical protein
LLFIESVAVLLFFTISLTVLMYRISLELLPVLLRLRLSLTHHC